MGYLEDQVDKLETRIRKIKANPDPTKPKGNLLLYEAELEKRKDQIKARSEGRPFALASNELDILLKALGFEICEPVRAADRISDDKVTYYSDQVKALGFPDYFCDRNMLCMPLMLGEGDLPRPKLVLTTSACELHCFSFNAVGLLLDVPVYHIDVPFEDDFNPHLGYVAKQLEEFIAFVEEKIPGIKYNEDKLRALVEVESEWYALNNQIYELRRRVPCPEHAQDVFRIPSRPSSFPNGRKIIEYMKAVRDDLSAKAERGYSPVKEEKLRLMWTNSGPSSSNIWNRLMERGVAVPYFQFGSTARTYGVCYPGMGDTTEYGRKLSPIEEVARVQLGNSFAGTAKRWIDQALTACRECKIDAIVNFDQVGCVPTVGYSRLLKDAAARELGIPSLNIIGRELIHTAHDEEKLLDQVDDFISSCLKRKGF